MTLYFWRTGLNVKLVFLSLLTLAVVIIFVMTTDVSRMMESIFLIEAKYLILAMIVYFISLGFRAFRWKYLLIDVKKVNVFVLFQAVCIGYMANNIMPFRIGELVRAYFLGSKEGISKTSVLVTVLVERILDSVTLIMFIIVITMLNPSLVFRSFGSEIIAIILPVLILLFMASFGVLIFAASHPKIIINIISAITKFLPNGLGKKIMSFSSFIVSGLGAINNFRSLGILLLLSLPVWLLEILVFCIIGYSMDMLGTYEDSLIKMFINLAFVTSITNIISAVPSAPGGIGIFELVVRELIVMGNSNVVDRSLAGGFALVVHGILIIPVIILGQLLLWSNNLSLKKMIKIQDSKKSI
jgi:uncharacterized protein (TIRG00374 family)